MLVVWKLDRLGRTLAHLVNTVQNLSTRGVGLRVLTGQGAQIDTTTAAAGRLVFGIFAALEQLFDIAERERVPKIPAHGATNQLGLRLSPLEDRRSDCLLHHLFRLPVAAGHSCNTTPRRAAVALGSTGTCPAATAAPAGTDNDTVPRLPSR